MKVDRSTKVILMLIAIGLFLNAADKFRVDPAEAQVNYPFPSTIHIKHYFQDTFKHGKLY